MTEENQQVVSASSQPLVLVVEDDSFLRGLLIDKLHKEGLSVAEATTGAEAHEILNRQTPAIILLDLMLPGTDGFQLLQEIKTNPVTKDVPVIVLSNLGEKEHVERAMSLGAADYMVKAHFVPDEIMDRIKSVLDR